MTGAPSVSAGHVAWSGDNSGLYLRETAGGPYVALASYFRVAWSPHGAGTALVLIEAPDPPRAAPGAVNACLYDNEPLARWLVEAFARHFQQLRGLAAMNALDWVRLDSHDSAGDVRTGLVERFRARGLDVALRWERIGDAFFVHLPPAASATGRHAMYSLFVDAADAGGSVNGRPLAGRVFPRDHLGRASTTAFLALSETWIES